MSMKKASSSPFCFIIHTDSQKFDERRVCAFVTGKVGECGVGDKDVQAGVDFSCLNDLIMMVSDEDKVYRPASTVPTPGVFNNGLGFHYREGQEDIALEAYRKNKGFENATMVDLGKYPGHQSVAIHLCHEPTPEQVSFMKERALMYGKSIPFNITNFEVIKNEE